MTTRRDWATGGAVKIERAEENIRDLAARISAFRQLKPYILVIQPDAQRTEHIGWVNARARIEPIWGAVAADALHNLRSVLDIVWRRATQTHPNRNDRRRKVYFPFCDAANELEARLWTAKETRIKTAFEIACSAAPYPGGNDLLCFVNDADLRDKHEIPTLLASHMGYLGDPSTNFFSNSLVLTFAGNIGSRPALKYGDIIQRFPISDPPIHAEIEIAFEVAFANEGPFKGQPVLHQLTACAQMVQSVVESFRLAGLLD